MSSKEYTSKNGKRFRFIIKEEWCKGCEICVAFCPTNTLAMRDFKVFVKNPSACTVCGLCEVRCPDFCIDVEKIERVDAQPEKVKI